MNFVFAYFIVSCYDFITISDKTMANQKYLYVHFSFYAWPYIFLCYMNEFKSKKQFLRQLMLNLPQPAPLWGNVRVVELLKPF